eukprot:1136484-Pelagomonas_calceolata.AAC.3
MQMYTEEEIEWMGKVHCKSGLSRHSAHLPPAIHPQICRDKPKTGKQAMCHGFKQTTWNRLARITAAEHTSVGATVLLRSMCHLCPYVLTDLASAYDECKMAVVGAVEGLLARTGLQPSDVVRLAFLSRFCFLENSWCIPCVCFLGDVWCIS